MSVDFCAELVRDKTGTRLASLKRCGAMWHWRIGRMGGSVYLARKPRRAVAPVRAWPVDTGIVSSSHGNRNRRRLAESLTFGVPATLNNV